MKIRNILQKEQVQILRVQGPLVNPDKILWPKIDSGLIFPE